MARTPSHLKGKRILAVDDEPDILETIADLLAESHVDLAGDYETASRKIRDNRYDMAVLDIMGVNGFQLLEEAVDNGIPTVMLTAHAVSPETLMTSIRRGAISYLPKETLAELDDLLDMLLEAYEKGDAPWKLLFDKLGPYFDRRFGPEWKESHKQFWAEFSKSYEIGRGIQARLRRDQRILDKGI